MDLSDSACALALYKYDYDRPGNELLGRFYAAVLGQLEACGVSPTYVGAEGAGFLGKLT